MNLNYAIFRSEPIYTLNDLERGIKGSNSKHIKRELNFSPLTD